ncbi:hypothetical protein [Bacillus atrophaeus]|uniref:hypothetical protein n=1 Tax=Bacillus atrophaeus TaxID=1452 RepID=UPI00209F2F85|nr:hypothetical protein [Bacillus atrophaeus]
MKLLNNIEPETQSRHKSVFNSTWKVHQFDIVMPSETRGKTISINRLYFRLANSTEVEVQGGFIDSWNGQLTTSLVKGTNNLYEPLNGYQDNYLLFEFQGIEIDVPENGILFFKIKWISGSNYRLDTGSSQYTTTYFQNDKLRPGNASFAIEYRLSIELELQIAHSDDGASFSEFYNLDISNIPQFRFLKIMAKLKGGGPIIETDASRQTPILSSIKINYDELSIEGRLTDLERLNAINMAKLNFKSNALLKSEKYKLYDMVIDTFEDDSLILINNNDSENKTSLYDKNQGRYIGEGTLETVSEEVSSYCKSIIIDSECEGCEFQYSLDNGINWSAAQLGEIIDVSVWSDCQLKIKIDMLTPSSVLTALSYAWA